MSSFEVTKVTFLFGNSSLISPAVSMPTGPPPTMRMFVAALMSEWACLKTAVCSAAVSVLPPVPTMNRDMEEKGIGRDVTVGLNEITYQSMVLSQHVLLVTRCWL